MNKHPYINVLAQLLRSYELDAEAFVLVEEGRARAAILDQTSDEIWAGLNSIASKNNIVLLHHAFKSDAWQAQFNEGNYPLILLEKTDDTTAFYFFMLPKKGQREIFRITDQEISSEGLATSELSWERFSKEGNIKVSTGYPNEPLFATQQTELSSKRTIINRLGAMLRQERKAIGYIFVYASIAGLIGLSVPLGVQSMVSYIASGRIVTSVFVLLFLIVLGLLVVGGLQIMQLYLTEYIQRRLFVRSAFAFSERITKLRIESIRNLYPPELVNRFFDIVTLQKGTATILMEFSTAGLQLVFGLLLLALYHPVFIMIAIVVFVGIWLFIRVTGPVALDTSIKESKYKYQIAGWLEDLARSILTFKVAGNSTLHTDKTSNLLRNYLYARRKHFVVLLRQYIGFVVFKTATTGSLLLTGCFLVINGEINLGQFIAAEIVVILLMNAVEKIIIKLDSVYDVLTSIDKLSQVTEVPIDMQVPGGWLLPNKNEGMSIAIQNLKYQFGDGHVPILDQLSLEINANERVCIAGYNGSGKTTLMHILLGSLNDWSGQILCDDLALQNIDRNSYHAQTGDYIAGEKLFTGTLYENIALGRSHISEDDVMQAISLAGLDALIRSFPEGLQTEIIADAANFSSGIVRKLILARCLVGKPRLLLLDDFLLGVERREKERLLEILLDKKHKWTVVLASNDPFILKRFERIVLLRDGRFVASGNWTELQQNNDFKELMHT
jgi:ABC-type bacteriocin/lantibiotic exporter with double-glycine peptidase domain